jgi:hypothetical protein
LGGGNLAIRHHLGDFASQGDRVDAAFPRRQIEPFMRSDEIDDAGASARPIQTALEQDVGDRGCRHRRCAIQIKLSLKHPRLPFVIGRPAFRERGPCPTVKTPCRPLAVCRLVEAIMTDQI